MKRANVLVLAMASGCFAYEKVPTERPAPVLRKIGEATFLDMTIDPMNQQPKLCPGAEGKLYMTAKVQWPEQKKPVNRNIGAAVDSLAPTAFSIESRLLTGDEQAHLHPSDDVLASVESGFPTHIVYKPIPKYAFDKTFPPEYSCFTGWWDNGGPGGGGGNGDYGGDAQDLGQSGGHGRNAFPGEQGKHGGRVTAVVTMVSTKYYPKLVAVIANDHFFLAPPDRRLTFGAVGGAGGQGGQGGAGGNGGNQRTESRTRYNKDTKSDETYTVGVGAAGRGGDGGDGARGGPGGDGGTVEVIYDAQFPELAQLVVPDVSGGDGGAPGAGGNGGAGGTSDAQENAINGDGGGGGNPSQEAGRKGRDGRGTVRAGSVSSKFNFRGIQILGRR